MQRLRLLQQNLRLSRQLRQEPVVCGTAGKVFKVVAKEGDAVKSGDTVIILEAMKMEIPVVAPKDGTVSSIVVKEGDSTTAGQAVAYIG